MSMIKYNHIVNGGICFMEIINGTVVKLIYQNTDNWYSVCDVEADHLIHENAFVSCGDQLGIVRYDAEKSE